jgi:tetratricopeptide (TPR) repeat protein
MTVYNLNNFHDNSRNLKEVSNCCEKNLYKGSFKGIEQDYFLKTPSLVTRKHAEIIKNRGNEYVKNNEYQLAVEMYKKALLLSPDYTDVHFNLGKVYRTTGDMENAIKSFKEVIKRDPKELETLTMIGNCFRDTEQFEQAKSYYREALSVDKKYDLANRGLKETLNRELAIINPEEAAKEKYDQSISTLKKSLQLAVEFMPEELTNKLHDVQFVFDKTGELGGKSNIAQYENNKRKIVVTDEYTWAAPEVVAAYLVHEMVHAGDKDPYTSITEEQDAYRESVKYWLINNNGIHDAEMDYAGALYKDGPKALDAKVAEIYSSRDSGIPMNSPKHGIAAFSVKSGLFKVKAAFSRLFMDEQSLKNMQIISDKRLKLSDYR